MCRESDSFHYLIQGSMSICQKRQITFLAQNSKEFLMRTLISGSLDTTVSHKFTFLCPNSSVHEDGVYVTHLCKSRSQDSVSTHGMAGRLGGRRRLGAQGPLVPGWERMLCSVVKVPQGRQHHRDMVERGHCN